MKRLLEVKGYSVLEAANGWDAVGLAKQAQPDLILMDLHLPVIDGVEVTCLLRQLEEFDDVPIIAMNGHDSVDSRADALDVGCDEYFTKPIDFERLGPAIDRLLSVSGSRSEASLKG